MNTIMIVEDSPSNIKMLGELLKDKYTLFIATDGDKAIEIAINQTPDLILMDVILPGIDGFEVCRKLKEIPKTKDIPVLFITALNNKDDLVKGFKSGGHDYITKPFYAEELFARIKTHIEIVESRRKLENYSVELSNKNKDLERALNTITAQAKTDHLTGLPNRKHILERMHEEASLFNRNRGLFSVALADIDSFKAVNDNYGHECGDQVLITFGKLLKESCREYDLVARWGGEEFLILFPKTSEEEAVLACENIRKKIASHKFTYEDLTLDITATFGVAEFADRFDVDELIKASDMAMYKGKNSGKNIVMPYSKSKSL